MSTTTSTTMETSLPKAAPWWEIVIVMLVYLGFGFFAQNIWKLIGYIPFLLYMIIESNLRHRSWADNGFSIRGIPGGLRKTWGWFLLVTFGTQALFIFGDKLFFPDVFQHIIARVPVDITALNAGLFITLAIGTFLEELFFRALFQNRLSAFLPSFAAVGIPALAFAATHFTAGTGLIVFIDLLSVFVDGLIFGIIFQRSRNIFVSWIPHFLCDNVAVFLILWVR